MMTSVARIQSKVSGVHNSRQGMTLLEVVIAISLMALLMGLGVVKFANGADERKIRAAVTRIEGMSSRGHAMAILHQKPFWLRLENGKVVLAGADMSAQGQSDDDYKPDLMWEEDGQSNEVIYDTFDTDVLVALRRWGAKEDAWTPAVETVPVIWEFQSSGLCEPVAFRLELGESWVTMTMHPLTARIEEEEMEIR